MKDLLGLLAQLRRPRLLIRAARAGAQDYIRERHLPRLLGPGPVLRPGPTLIQLMEAEAEINDKRLTKEATYSISHHIELLVAIMGEARALREQRYGPG